MGNGEVADSSARTGGLHTVKQTAWALGAEVSVVALHERRDVADRAVAAALEELKRVDGLMSLYRPDSELCRLNRQGRLDRPHPYLVEVLRQAQAMSDRSGGAFDVTVQPLWELYAAAKKAGRIPETGEIEAARRRVDWHKIEVAPERICLTGDGMAVTLNAIAQGFAADRVLAELRDHGVAHALVNTGEIGALGGKENGKPWTVGIQHPRRPDAYVALVALEDRCMATSGDYATAFSGDHLYHHIFDPATGRSPDAFSSVTIVAPGGAEADALATAVFVLGPEKGLHLVRSSANREAFFVFKDGRTLATEGFPETSAA